MGANRTLLITGASGYLGSHLLARSGPAWRAVGTHLQRRPPPGIESHRVEIRDAPAVEALLGTVRPDAVIHTAYRQHEPDVNLAGTRNVARACERLGARLVLVSTDMVFDGRRGWYRETDPTNPLGPYGESKVAAEREVLARGGVAARTSLIYSFDPIDPITDKLIVGPAGRGERSNLFVDEFRCPTYAPDLADALLELAGGSFAGLLHLSGPQRLSRYEFGLKVAEAYGLDHSVLRPSRREDSGLVRPGDCSLDTSLARQLLGSRIRSVDEAIEANPRLGQPFGS